VRIAWYAGWTTYLLHVIPVRLVIDKEPILARLVLLAVLEVGGNFDGELPVGARGGVEFAEVIELAGGDEEVVFRVGWREKMLSAAQDTGREKRQGKRNTVDLPLVVLVKATW
jgi:hypothetical protein